MAKFNKENSLVAVAILVVICVVCVGVLALLNDLLYVSPEVVFSRAMSKIYPDVEFKQYSAQDQTKYATSDAYGSAFAYAYNETSGLRTVVIDATGKGGYGGSIGLYVVVKEVKTSGKTVAQIAAWSIKDPGGETLLGNIESGVNVWYVGEDVANELPLSKVGGVTMSSTAINNAINEAGSLARGKLEMGSNPEQEALTALTALLEGDYATATYASVKTSFFPQLSTDSATLSYVFSANVSDQEIYALVYDVAGSQEYAVINVTANDADRNQFIYKSEGIDDALAQVVAGNYYTTTAYVTSFADDGTNYVYNVVGLKQNGFVPGNYEFAVTVNADGEVQSVVVTSSGFVGGAPSEESTLALATAVVGKTLADLDDSFLANNKAAGATQSATIIFNAVKLVLTHFEANIGGAL